MSETYYKIWRWKDAPAYLKGKTSLSSGSWVVRYPVGYVFPLNELNLNENPQWEVDICKCDADWVAFIRDKEDEDWEFFADYDMFGTKPASQTGDNGDKLNWTYELGDENPL